MIQVSKAVVLLLLINVIIAPIVLLGVNIFGNYILSVYIKPIKKCYFLTF